MHRATEASHRRQSTRRPTADKTLEVVLVCIANVAAIRVGLPVSIASLLNSKSFNGGLLGRIGAGRSNAQLRGTGNVPRVTCMNYLETAKKTRLDASVAECVRMGAATASRNTRSAPRLSNEMAPPSSAFAMNSVSCRTCLSADR